VSPDATGTVSNTASAVPPAGATDPDPSNNDVTDSDDLPADLAIAKTGPTAVIEGSQAVYTIVVTNTGPSTAADVIVTDETPPGLTFVSNTGACTTPFPCALGAIAPGYSRTIRSIYAASGVAGTSAVNTATVASSSFDPSPSNNASSAATQFIIGPPPPTSTTLADISGVSRARVT
jgi:uncharacterized repeat protein (TIGR01451 family)